MRRICKGRESIKWDLFLELGKIASKGPYLDSHAGSMPQRPHHLPCYNKADHQKMEQDWYSYVYDTSNQNHMKRNIDSTPSNRYSCHQQVSLEGGKSKHVKKTEEFLLRLSRKTNSGSNLSLNTGWHLYKSS